MDEQRRQAEGMRTSTRDLEELRERFRSWLTGRVGAPVTISRLAHPSGNGMSSETLIFDARWTSGGEGREDRQGGRGDGVGEVHEGGEGGEGGENRRGDEVHEVRCVARMAPASEAVPVFPDYDLGRQFEVMRLVRERAGVPVPATLWYEPDPGPLGAPFFVMERLEGDVPPDVLPYTFEGWLLEASPADRALLQRRSVEILARLHDAPFTAGETDALRPPGTGGSALRRHVDEQRAYYEWAHGAMRLPLLERAFAWLEEHWPADPGPDVLSWGDARIGNVMYRDFTPVGVLDWEMATVAPRELDLGWMIFLHRFFQDVAESMGLPGLPDFMRSEDVCRIYEEMTGYTPRDMEFYEVYAALRHGVIMARVWHRRIHFGEQPMPADPDDLVLHRRRLERMIGEDRRS